MICTTEEIYLLNGNMTKYTLQDNVHFNMWGALIRIVIQWLPQALSTRSLLNTSLSSSHCQLGTNELHL